MHNRDANSSLKGTHLGLARRIPRGTLRLLLVVAEQLSCLLLNVAGGRLDVAGELQAGTVRDSAGTNRCWPDMTVAARRDRDGTGKLLASNTTVQRCTRASPLCSSEAVSTVQRKLPAD